MPTASGGSSVDVSGRQPGGVRVSVVILAKGPRANKSLTAEQMWLKFPPCRTVTQ